MFDTETVGENVNAPPVFVMFVPTVTPFEVAAELVARVSAPVCVLPYVCARERTPVFEMVTFPVAEETEMPEPATFERTPEFEMTPPEFEMPEPQVNKEEVAIASEFEEPRPIKEPVRPRPRVAEDVAD